MSRPYSSHNSFFALLGENIARKLLDPFLSIKSSKILLFRIAFLILYSVDSTIIFHGRATLVQKNNVLKPWRKWSDTSTYKTYVMAHL